MAKIQFIYFTLVCSIVFSTFVGCKFIDVIEQALSKHGTKSNVTRIVGGEKAKIGEFPGVVSIQTTSRDHFCGGTLISPSLILTAAHCVVHRGTTVDPRIIIVMGDDLRIANYDAIPTRQYRRVNKIVMHGRYNPETQQNDIALITVETPFLITNTFSPVNITDVAPVDNEPCRVAGWGYIYPNSEELAEQLMAVNITVIPMDVCNGTHSYSGKIPTTALCAGYLPGGRDSCQGDSGGGLMCNDTVKGIVSWGFGCAEKNFPGVYTDVYQYREWIKANSGNSITSMFAMSTIIMLFFGLTKMRDIFP